MDKNNSIKEQIKTKKDVKEFFRKVVADKQAWIDCACNGRSMSELEERGMKVAKLSDILD